MTKRVFISYAWESGQHKEHALLLWRLLRAQGIESVLDMPGSERPKDWSLWMADQIRHADVVLCLASREYRERAEGRAGARGRGVQYEARLIRNAIVENPGQEGRFVAVVLPGQSVDGVPDFLTPATRSIFHVTEFTPEGAIDLLRFLLEQDRISKPPLGPVPDLDRIDPRVRVGRMEPEALTALPARSPLLYDWRDHATADIDVDASLLIGVEDVVSRVQEVVEDENRGRVVTLTGQGGIGKTAIAHEVAKRCATSGGFTRIAWAAADAAFSLESDRTLFRSRSWQDLVSTIGEQLGFELGVDRSRWEDTVNAKLKALPSAERILVVVDNLESVEGPESVVGRLNGLGFTGRHSILLTTRNAILTRNSRAVTEERVQLMSGEAAVELVRHIGSSDTDLTTVDAHRLGVIFEVTEGIPFLIKLVVRRYLNTGLPLDRVLSEMTTLGNDQTGRLPADRVRDYLYRQSFEALDTLCGPVLADALMSAFCTYQKTTQFTYDRLQKRSRIADAPTFDHILSTACQLTLVRPVGVALKRKYLIHSLLHQYNCRLG